MVALHLSMMSVLSASGILSLMFASSIVDFMLKQYASSAFLAVIFSRCFSSSLRNFSASFTIRSMSSLLRRPLSLVIVMRFSLLVDFSMADTFMMPFASISNWRHVQQQQILYRFRRITLQNGGLDSRTVRNGLIRVDGLVQLLAIEEVLQQFLYLGDAG
uniref:Uncharacterized protein n=1 Tax=Anopheles maculatus TaxID=74869 RepID=A0A182T5U6_9DIPT